MAETKSLQFADGVAVEQPELAPLEGSMLAIQEQASTPATPEPGKVKVYLGADGKLYWIDSDGNIREVGSGAGAGINFNENPNFETDAGGLTDVGTGTTLSRTTTTTEIPLYPTRETAIKVLFGSSGTGHAQIARFTVPEALAGHVLPIDWVQRVGSTYLADEAKVELYVYANSDYSDGSPTEVGFRQDDSSGNTYLLPADGQGRVEFIADSSAYYYELRAVRVAGGGAATDWIAFNEIRPTYEKSVPGLAVSPNVTFTPSFTNGPTTPVYTFNNYSQVGENIRVRVLGEGSAGGTTTFYLNWNLTGITPDLDNGDVVHLGKLMSATAAGPFRTVAGIWDSTNSRFSLFFTDASDNQLATFSGASWSAGRWLDLDFSIPVNEWAGQGVNMLNVSRQSPLKAGLIMAWPDSTLPTGWLECNGSAVSRTTYRDLFAVIGSKYGSGDGSTTFNLPDYRGYFLRGQDGGAGNDPDAASRTTRGDGTTGDNVGTKQADAYKSHAHDLNAMTGSGSGSGNFFGGHQATYGGSIVEVRNYSGGFIDPIQVAGGNETRPKNVNVKWIIKAHNDSVDLAGNVLATAERAGLVSGGKVPGQTDGSAIATGYVGEYLTDFAATDSITTTAGVDIDTDLSLTLSPGTWMIGYDVTVATSNPGASDAAIYARTKITDSSNTTVDGTVRMSGSGGTPPTNTNWFPCSARAVVSISTSKTYKVRIACSRDAAAGTANISDTSITGGFSDPDNQAVMWALRIA